MRHALLNGKEVHGEELTWKHKSHIFTCLNCGKDLILIISTVGHRSSHFRHGHHESCGTSGYNYVRQHSLEKCDELKKLSDVNTLLMCDGDPHTLTFSQRRNLRGAGFLKMRGCYEMELTPVALELLRRRK